MRLSELRLVLARQLLSEISVPGLRPWPEGSKQVPEISEADLAAKVGPFERRLADVLGGDVVGGGSKSYDIVAAGAKYEVKKPNHNAVIRVGGEGTAAFAHARGEIEKACKALEAAFRPNSVVFDSLIDVMGKEDVELATSFVHNDVPALMRGNFSVSRMKKFHTVITNVAIALRADENAGDKILMMGDDEHTVERNIDVQTYTQIGQMLDVPPEEMGVSSVALAASSLDSPAFDDPDGFMRENWTNAVKASQSFPGVDFIALVAPAGYRIVPIEEVDDVLTFIDVASGRVEFRVTG